MHPSTRMLTQLLARLAVPFLMVVPLARAAAQDEGFTSPATGDTAGYWQQRVAYTIVARLDETAQRVRASGTLRYVNNSPDTLRAMYVHQYLNAFRPHSAWSREDEREGVERFQHLRDPDYGYERFTAPVRVNGTPVTVTWPGAPDSTVARFALPSPLPPGDSLEVTFEWEARPSTLPRRQGRRARSWDLAQWYPKVAVYDRGGWEAKALRPAGEFYGEFGTYDVTLIVADDQLVGATGVPVSGDPGWSRAIRGGSLQLQRDAYASVDPAREVSVPSGFKAVRFVARDVHHFAWSVSPDYRYEGGVFVREPPATRQPAWDTVAIHALYRPGDDSTWGGLRAVNRTRYALEWLEAIYGPYAYPQMTVLHRIEGGGTEFPMMQMNGSASQGLILHEGGHNFSYGILANNEWRSGWMDEGLTSYQTEWAQGLTPQERLRAGVTGRFMAPTGYRAHAITPRVTRFDAIGLQQSMTDLGGAAQPIGTAAQDFRDFSTYNDMIYTRAQVMYGQLRDAIGDAAFVDFLHDYYARWALRHVDERAMRGSAERASGRDLRWFFDEWVHHTGVMDYALDGASWSRADSGWVTLARVRRRGEYRHPIAVGVRTARGWRLAQLADVAADRQTLRVVTPDEPLEVRLDPLHFSWDWDRRNDVLHAPPRVNVDWPLLQQMDRERSVLLLAPMAWYGEPGGVTAGARFRSSYLDLVDRYQLGVVSTTRTGIPAASALQYWVRVENPYLPWASRPAVGWSAGAARLDDVVEADVGYSIARTVAAATRTYSIRATFADPRAVTLLPESWSAQRTLDVALGGRHRRDLARGGYWFAESRALAGVAQGRGGYGKVEGALGRVAELDAGTTVGVRLYAGAMSNDAPPQRALLISSRDPLATFGNHWWRPRGALLKQDGAQWLPLGGAALRGVAWDVQSNAVTAANLDLARRVAETRGSAAQLDFRVHAFADAAVNGGVRTHMADAGAGLSLRGRVYDRDVFLRVDLPLFVRDPTLATGAGPRTRGQVAFRWLLTTSDIW